MAHLPPAVAQCKAVLFQLFSHPPHPMSPSNMHNLCHWQTHPAHLPLDQDKTSHDETRRGETQISPVLCIDQSETNIKAHACCWLHDLGPAGLSPAPALPLTPAFELRLLETSFRVKPSS